MSPGSALRVAIVGGGPSGAALGILLAGSGADVVLFDDGRRPELVVGESLIPAVIPSLRRLGVEEAVAAIGLRKPGASFTWSASHHFGFTFARYGHRMTPYAYNVPRPAFDRVLLARAGEVGVRRVEARARLLPGSAADGPELSLDPRSMEATGWGAAGPDLIVDATGRARLTARLLDIPARAGPRHDVAHFAHYQGFAWDEAVGQVLIGRVPGGWSWRIPLPDRLSVGVVLDRAVASSLGDSAEERLEASIVSSDALRATLRHARRVSGVATYSNYQLVSTRGHGPGWVAVGDAFGFVDPMLSPGVMVALCSAEILADRLAPLVRLPAGAGVPPERLTAALRSYARSVTGLLDAWMELVEYLYDGRMLALVRAGSDMMEQRGGRLAGLLQDHIEANVAGLASGTDILSTYSRGLLRFLGRWGLRGVSPAELAVGAEAGLVGRPAYPATGERAHSA